MHIPAPLTPTTQEGSQLRRFLAERGVMMMKENRPIANIPTLHGAPLEVSGQILVITRGPERSISTGVKFEESETSNTIGSAAFVDFDELEEFLGAFQFVKTAAAQMANQRRDYTEVTYSTRDDVTIGFYHTDAKQQAFVRLGVGSRAMFFFHSNLSGDRRCRPTSESARHGPPGGMGTRAVVYSSERTAHSQ